MKCKNIADVSSFSELKTSEIYKYGKWLPFTCAWSQLTMKDFAKEKTTNNKN